MILTKRNIEEFNPYIHLKEYLDYIADEKDAIVLGFTCYNLDRFAFFIDDIKKKLKGFLSYFTCYAGIPYWYSIGYDTCHIPFVMVANSENGCVKFIVKKTDIEQWECTVLNKIHQELTKLEKQSKKVGLDYEIVR